MEVREILATKGVEVVTIGPHMPAVAAAQLMERRRVGAVVVSSDGVTLEGIVRESEIVAAVADGHGSLGSTAVSDLMLSTVPTCTPEDHVKDVMELMTRTRSRHVPVVDDGRLCGLVSVGDLVKHRLDELDLESRVLRDVYRARS